jgi:low affinity Fe/Cu permease
MVFLIQSTQNRDTESIQVKLDELIRAVGHARNELLDLEELEECDLDDLKQTFIELAKKARRERLQPRASSPEK